MAVLFGTYILICAAQIVSAGGFLNSGNSVLVWFSAVTVGLIVAFFWDLFINAIVSYQFVEDGTPLSIYGLVGSSFVVFIGATYIGMDTADNISNHLTIAPGNYNLPSPGLFTLNLLWPIIAAAVYLILQTILVVKALGEWKPLLYLYSAFSLFALGQVFQFLISYYICNGTHKLNGAMFSTILDTAAMVVLFFYWSSITEGRFQARW